MFNDDDDHELASAIYGQQASVSPPQPTMSALGTAPVKPAAPAQAPQQPQHITGSAAQPAGVGSDMYAGIYGGQQQSPQPQAGLADAGAGSTQGTPLKGGATQPGGQAQPGDDRIATYKDAVSRLSQSTDPATRAREQDNLARSLQTDLAAAGRQVKWDGDVMVIDGRRYTLGSGATIPDSGPGGMTGRDNPIVDSQDPIAAGVLGAGGGGSASFSGFDQAKYGKDDPKYVFQRIASSIPNNDPDRAAKLQAALRADPSGYFANAQIDGDKLYVNNADPVFNGVTGFDYQIDQENGGDYAWQPLNGQGGAAAGGGPGVLSVGAPGAAGLPTGGGTPGSSPGATPGWSLTGPTYTPGAITDDDIPDFTTEGLAAQMGGYTPGHRDVGNLDVGPVEGDVDSLMRGILQRPESLSPEDIERMKVSGREEQADMEKGDMDELTALGYETGNESAPWLASQRLARRGQTSEAVSRSNRNVDIEAARTNQEDRRQAAALGSSHLAEVGTRQRGNEALRQSAAQNDENNAFNSAKLKSDNVTNSAKLSLDAAAAKGDRMALRESVNQAAAQLGQSADKLMLDYVTSTRDDLTRRYGIDVDAALKQQGIQVDWATLGQRGSEFQQDLAFKMKQLANQHEVDMGGLGLGYDTLEQRANEADMDFLSRGIYG